MDSTLKIGLPPQVPPQKYFEFDPPPQKISLTTYPGKFCLPRYGNRYLKSDFRLLGISRKMGLRQVEPFEQVYSSFLQKIKETNFQLA